MMFFRSSPPDSSKDETPKSPLSISSSSSPPQKPQPAGPGPQFKNRIQSWLRDAEEDAEKADQYLDKKREKKKESKRDIVDKTDVIKTMEAIEKVRRCISFEFFTFHIISHFISGKPRCSVLT